MSDKEFCELYNSYTGESGIFSGIDNPKQLTVNMTGTELKEWTEFVLKQANEANEQQEQALRLRGVTKRTFFFDYLGAAYRNDHGQLVADSRTQEIEAYDEEHATLLFKEMHPDKTFDFPY